MAENTNPNAASPSTKLSPAQMFPYCTHLASKKLLLRSEPARTDRDVLDASNHCWCNRTMQVIGPDRDMAHPEECRSGRECFESRFKN
jgi:hypothetical protein